MLIGGERMRVDEIEKVDRNIIATSECLKNSLKNDDVARDPERAFLSVSVLLRRFIEKFHEDRVIHQIGAHNESLHFLADVDRNVAGGDRVRRPAPRQRRRFLPPASRRRRPRRGDRIGAEKRVR